MKPSIGRIVHYVSYGTPGGEYEKECRAAVVTDVPAGKDPTEDPSYVGLAVLNPAGLFFDRDVRHSEDENQGGTWHWPERVSE
jgi:hypothetical protein